MENKRILNAIAKEWASAILYHVTGTDSFDEDVEELLTVEEQSYIVDKVRDIALKINKGDVPDSMLDEIISKYFEIKD